MKEKFSAGELRHLLSNFAVILLGSTFFIGISFLWFLNRDYSLFYTISLSLSVSLVALHVLSTATDFTYKVSAMLLGLVFSITNILFSGLAIIFELESHSQRFWALIIIVMSCVWVYIFNNDFKSDYYFLPKHLHREWNYCLSIQTIILILAIVGTVLFYK